MQMSRSPRSVARSISTVASCQPQLPPPSPSLLGLFLFLRQNGFRQEYQPEVAVKMPKDKIFLVGFMGSGKSTVGALLAAKLGLDFVDLDREIESEEGKSIREIFEGQGEAEFRRIETNHLRSLKDRPAS